MPKKPSSKIFTRTTTIPVSSATHSIDIVQTGRLSPDSPQVKGIDAIVAIFDKLTSHYDALDIPVNFPGTDYINRKKCFLNTREDLKQTLLTKLNFFMHSVIAQDSSVTKYRSMPHRFDELISIAQEKNKQFNELNTITFLADKDLSLEDKRKIINSYPEKLNNLQESVSQLLFDLTQTKQHIHDFIIRSAELLSFLDRECQDDLTKPVASQFYKTLVATAVELKNTILPELENYIKSTRQLSTILTNPCAPEIVQQKVMLDRALQSIERQLHTQAEANRIMKLLIETQLEEQSARASIIEECTQLHSSIRYQARSESEAQSRLELARSITSSADPYKDMERRDISFSMRRSLLRRGSMSSRRGSFSFDRHIERQSTSSFPHSTFAHSMMMLDGLRVVSDEHISEDKAHRSVHLQYEKHPAFSLTLDEKLKQVTFSEESCVTHFGTNGGLTHYYIYVNLPTELLTLKESDKLIEKMSRYASAKMLSRVQTGSEGFIIIPSPNHDGRQLLALKTSLRINGAASGNSRVIFVIHKVSNYCHIAFAHTIMNHDHYEKLYNNQELFNTTFNAAMSKIHTVSPTDLSTTAILRRRASR